MPDPGCDTLQHRLRVLEGRLVALADKLGTREPIAWGAVDALTDALAELRSLERAVAERPELSGTRLSHGETP